ncbi:sigma factor-like helix-turn-helix DNA-binding protein [Nocardiopsis sp. CT-R113]|uniref:Sigma factor-like helix-turn-helix DNA-binding protein n=1 Tax=Nocardiopsis codii TaxID=3065942 RepID=A0ABU7K988_9ACTN|nr:sigma factor-like helix-turn-helix DNA-binding protein [Nocardiopsis sp. CT-R113]MEE2038803.1 sigma factor-like helix-turn-helix DNA-binding protein [Nocardiopsis sp. CT-R113]
MPSRDVRGPSLSRPVDFRLTDLVPALDRTCDDLVTESLGHPSLPEERWWRRLRLPLVLGRVGADHLAAGMARLALRRWEGQTPGEVMPALYVSGLPGAGGDENPDHEQLLSTPLWRLTAETDEGRVGAVLRDGFLSVLERLPREQGRDDRREEPAAAPASRPAESTGPAEPVREAGAGKAAAGASTGDPDPSSPVSPAHAEPPAGTPDTPAPVSAVPEPRPAADHLREPEPAVRPELTSVSLLSEVDSWFAVGDERHRAVASRRIFTDSPDTLDTIGADFGVTRERIRQIHKQVEQDLRSWSESPFGDTLRAHVDSVSARLGTAAPLDAFWALRPEHTLTVPSLGIPLGRVVLGMLPAHHRTAEDWLVTESADTLATDVAALLETRAALPLTEVLETAHASGVLTEHARAWLETLPQTRVVADRLVRWGRSLPDKAFAVLSALERPLHVDELISHIGGGFNEAGFRDRIHNDDRLIRRDRRVFGLRAWGGEEYLGVEETMRRELGRAGGQMHVTELAELISSRFDVTEGSVRALAAGSEFTRPRAGWVGLPDGSAPAADSYRPRRTVERTRRCFRTDGTWWLRLDLNAEHLRGSGFPMPIGFASWAGMYPGARTPVRIGDRDAVAAWKNQPLMSSVRTLLLEADATEGDHAFITISEGRVVCRVSPAECPHTAPLSRALHLAGVTGTGGGPGSVSALTAAIGLEPGASLQEAREHLADRGDSDILAVLGSTAEEVRG